MSVNVEPGGCGSVGATTYMWIVDGDDISAAFDTGHWLHFPNTADGWGGFLAYAVVLGGLV